MKTYKIFTVFSILLLCSCTNVTVYSDFDKRIDFKNYKTYFICVDDMEVTDLDQPIYDNTFNRGYIRNAITAEMNFAGYKMDEFNPDLFVSFRIVINKKQTSVRTCSGIGAYDYWPDCRINTYDYTEGTLVIFVSDVKKNQVVWQGSALGILNIPPQKMKKIIDRTVQQIFKKFPKENIKNKDDVYSK